MNKYLLKAKKAFSFFLGFRDILAVDIGSYAVKVCWIRQNAAGRPVLGDWGYLPLKLKLEATDVERKARISEVLRPFLNKKKIKIRDAATGVSGNAVIVRYVKFPRLTRTELTATLAAEAESFIPFDINEVQLGFHILNDIVDAGQKKMETVLVAVKKELIASRLDALQSAGLFPAIIDVDSFALESVHEQIRGLNVEAGGATLYLNIGHTATNLSIIEKGVTRVVRDVFIAGGTFTKSIMKALYYEYEQAEEAKKAHGIMVDPAQKEQALSEGNREALGVSQALVSVTKDLTAEVERSIDFYLSQGSERSIGRIVLSGGGARTKNLDKQLAAELKAPVSVLNPFAFLKTPADFPAELAPLFGVATGLALRRTRDWIDS